MVNILLLSHGPFCEGLLASLQMIVGPQKQIYAIQLHPGQSPDDYRDKISDVLVEMVGDTIVFCDIKGGTPYNSAGFLKNKYSFTLITGMNLPMLISVATVRNEKTTVKELTNIALDKMSAGIELINLSLGGERKHAKLSLNKNR